MLADADLFGLDYAEIEDTAKELYIRALKILPPQVKRGFDRLALDRLAEGPEMQRQEEREEKPGEAMHRERHIGRERAPAERGCGERAHA